MTNRALRVAIVFLFLPAAAFAQNSAMRPLIVPLENGGFIGFRSDFARIDTSGASVDPRAVQSAFDSQALVDGNHVVHRVLVDAMGRIIFGYDLLVETTPATKQFKISVGPLEPQFEQKLRERASKDPQPAKSDNGISTLPRSTTPQVLDDGDAFTLDLLINQTTGVKIVDVVKVSFDRSKLWDVRPKALPQDFTLDAVELSINNFRLLINGSEVAVGKPARSCAGALIWMYVPDRGRFIFSLVPREGYAFQKIGLVDENKIEFTVKGDHYEWLSSFPVLPGGGTWNLWVLHDPKYVPLVYEAQQTLAKEKDKRSGLDIDSAVRAARDELGRMNDEKQRALQNDGDDKNAAFMRSGQSNKRLRVVIGGADRIENLWPK